MGIRDVLIFCRLQSSYISSFGVSYDGKGIIVETLSKTDTTSSLSTRKKKSQGVRDFEGFSWLWSFLGLVLGAGVLLCLL
jgi:hypothetical protein